MVARREPVQSLPVRPEPERRRVLPELELELRRVLPELELRRVLPEPGQCQWEPGQQRVPLELELRPVLPEPQLRPVLPEPVRVAPPAVARPAR